MKEAMIRDAVVSGQFYPADAQELRRSIEQFKPQKTVSLNALGIIIPHAGYVYSGKVAVAAVSRVIPKRRLIILGPNHTGRGEVFAIPTEDKWRIPFGDITIDKECAERILEKGNYIKEDSSAHNFEHSIEVELPIIYYFFGSFTFLPISCQASNIDSYKNAAHQICAGIKEIKHDIFFAASTDMTHYEPDSAARKKDRDALEAIVNLDEEALIKKVHKENISMCGVAPVAILIMCLKSLGARKAQVALYQTSGDACGDYSSVVGYAGVIIS